MLQIHTCRAAEHWEGLEMQQIFQVEWSTQDQRARPRGCPWPNTCQHTALCLEMTWLSCSSHGWNILDSNFAQGDDWKCLWIFGVDRRICISQSARRLRQVTTLFCRSSKDSCRKRLRSSPTSRSTRSSVGKQWKQWPNNGQTNDGYFVVVFFCHHHDYIQRLLASLLAADDDDDDDDGYYILMIVNDILHKSS